MDAYLCVSIDCECDKGERWRIKKPLSFDAVTAGIGARLQPLFQSFGAKPTYLLSPEVLRDAAALDCLTALDGSAEFGTHLHGEFIAPDAFEPDETTAFQCNYPPTVERQKLEGLTLLFRKVFGFAPRSFRAGRFGIGPHSLGCLADLGYVVDSSVSPRKSWAKAGAPVASFLQAPYQPYWPVHAAPARVAATPGPLLEVPVTILPSRFAGWPLIGGAFEPRWLRPTHGTAAGLVQVARDAVARAAGAAAGARLPVVLNCMFHNVEIMPGLSPYARTATEADAILARLAGLLDFARREGIAVVGLGDIAELFTPAARL
jgi:hypothetical protein